MDLGLKDKVAIVAGASKGLGYAVALGLAREGAKVAICSRDRERIEAAGANILPQTGAVVFAAPADVTQREDGTRFVGQVIDRFGGVDILVTNAGGPPSGTFDDFGEQDWRNAVELNFMSALHLIYNCVPSMRQRGGGRIITITSSAVKEPIDGLTLSNAVRLAVVGLTKTLSRELAKDKVLVNSVLPTWTWTERVQEIMRFRAQKAGTTPEEEAAKITRNIPLGRMAQPEEFANVVVFLASERASFLSGLMLQIDGGQYKGVF